MWMDGNGLLDIIIANSGDDKIFLRLNQGGDAYVFAPDLQKLIECFQAWILVSIRNRHPLWMRFAAGR